MVEAVEGCASAPLYALLKREDEKHVTEQAYDNPRFVEDLVREVVLAVRELPGEVRWMRVSARNEESIHNHAAYAEIEWSREEEVAARTTELNVSNRQANLYLDILTHDIKNANTVSVMYADMLTEMVGSLSTDGQCGASRQPDDLFSDTSEDHSAEATPAVCAGHDQIDVVLGRVTEYGGRRSDIPEHLHLHFRALAKIAAAGIPLVEVLDLLDDIVVTSLDLLRCIEQDLDVNKVQRHCSLPH